MDVSSKPSLIKQASFVLTLLFFLPSLLMAKVSFSGYLKSLNFSTQDSGDKKVRGLSGNRARGEFRWQDLDQVLDFRIVADHEFLYGSLLSSQKVFAQPLAIANELFDFNWTLNEKENLIWRQSLYRLALSFQRDGMEGTVGRQRVAWGQGRIWSPLDVVNPYNPLSPEKEERAGSDAVVVKNSFSDLSFIEGVAVPKRKFRGEQSIFMGRARVNLRQTDWTFYGGKKEDELLVGTDHASQILDGSFRSEAAYFWGSNSRTDFFRGVLSYDYSFSNTLYILAEFYANGAGKTVKVNEQNFLGKDYFGCGLSYEITPLLKGSFYEILNLEDHSLFLAPKLEWKALTDLELTLTTHSFFGDGSSEWGSRQDIAFLQVQWFFSKP